MTSPRLDSTEERPGPPPPPPGGFDSAPGTRSATSTWADRFFSWTAGLGVVRGDGWIGGVAAGLAARMRVDPLIVRGILVVVAVFGFPVLFLYGVAWALLPDLDGRIPLQEGLRGRVTPALFGSGGLAILGLIPAPSALLIGLPTVSVSSYDGGGWFALVVVLAIVGALIVAGLTVIIVRAALRAPHATAPAAPETDERTASAASEAPDESAAASGSGPDAASADRQGVDAAGFAASAPSPDDVVTAPVDDEPIEPAAPASDDPASASASADDEYAAWREQHAAWKEQDDAWRRQQQDAARAAREQARRERQTQAAAFSAEAAERRRIRRLTAPRTPFAYVATVLGIALVAGTIVALQHGSDLAAARGLFVAALVIALGMVVASTLRRRSGFLAFATVLLLAGGAAGLATPTLVSMHPGGYGISNAPGAESWPASAPFVQPWGYVNVALFDTREPTEPIHIVKRTGSTFVLVDEGVATTVDITVPVGMLTVYGVDGSSVYIESIDGLERTGTPDGRVRYRGTLPSGVAEPTTRQTLVVDQQSGGVDIQLRIELSDDTEESQ